LICSRCGYSFNFGSICPSCGYNDTDNDPEAVNRRTPEVNVVRPATATSVDPAPSAPVTPIPILDPSERVGDKTCQFCGFHYSVGKACPACGHINSPSGTKDLSQINSKPYEYRP
jgi:RNA polymerase subunit RPABC4/transcription elongation factor Spt4